MLWIDKYRPTSLDKLDFHTDLAARLKRMLQAGDFPHLLFTGPSGAGKKTRVMALLRYIYGPAVERLRIERKQLKHGNTKVEVTTVGSAYHIEMTPADAGVHDRVVVMEIIKEVAQTVPIRMGAQGQLVATQQQTEATSQAPNFKIIVLNEVDRLSRFAQHALRRTMEKYMGTCRLILLCNSSSNLIDPLKSRCLNLRIPAPTHAEIIQVLMGISHAERLGLQTTPGLAQRLAEASHRNLRRAILLLEACRVQQFPLQDHQEIPFADWERYVQEIAQSVLEEQSAKRLLETRKRLSELLVNCVPPDVIFGSLARALLSQVDSELKPQIVEWAALFEHRMAQGSKPIVHLEAFLARFMALHKSFMLSLNARE